MQSYVPHPDKPTLTNGAISFVAEHTHAAVEYRLAAPGAGETLPTLTDLHDAERVDGWETIDELQDLLSPVVYPTMADYRRRRGWPLPAVLVAAGVDPELVSDDLDDLDGDPEWSEDASRYNFALAPGDYVIEGVPAEDRAINEHDGREYAVVCRRTIAGGVAVDVRRPSNATEWPAHTPDRFTTNEIYLTPAPRAPGRYTITSAADEIRATVEGVDIDYAAAHARAWQLYQAEHTPRGWELHDTEDGWIWRSCDGELVGPPGHLGVESEAEARAGCWRDFLADDTEPVLDTLLLTDLWPESSLPLVVNSGPEKLAAIAECDRIIAARRAWIGGWSLLERGQAVLWAIACHLRASDNDDVEIPDMPACLHRNRPA